MKCPKQDNRWHEIMRDEAAPKDDGVKDCRGFGLCKTSEQRLANGKWATVRSIGLIGKLNFVVGSRPG